MESSLAGGIGVMGLTSAWGEGVQAGSSALQGDASPQVGPHLSPRA